MLTTITTLWLALIALLTPVADREADALLKTAPMSTYLTTRDGAREHIAAARAAGVVFSRDPAMLLAIAAHESDYKVDARTLELKGSKISCGVMTPEPMSLAPKVASESRRICDLVTSSPLVGYLDGARHLRTWIIAKRDLRTALMGYVGGGFGIEWCRDSEHRRTDYRCWTPEWFLSRAATIRGDLAASAGPPAS